MARIHWSQGWVYTHAQRRITQHTHTHAHPQAFAIGVLDSHVFPTGNSTNLSNFACVDGHPWHRGPLHADAGMHLNARKSARAPAFPRLTCYSQACVTGQHCELL